MESASPHPSLTAPAEPALAPAPAATTPAETAAAATLKRKRSPSISSATPTASNPPPAAKASKTSSSNQLSINYLVRQSDEDLPLINKDDTLPSLLSLLGSYSNILDRHESIASNLGAKPLGPILIKRFERCFDKPPKVVASHHKGAATAPDDNTHSISWYEVIEFARSHPAQFTLDTFSQGSRVCQFYYPQKQLRVQVSEEDFLFINSGRCQELIPPLPIWEDEEKEVGTCDVLEAKLKELTNAADMVAARTRQLGHRLKGRRAAILERRAEGGSSTPAKANAPQTTTAPPTSTPAAAAGFTSVNNAATNGKPSDTGEANFASSTAVRNDLLRHFESLPHNQNQSRPQHRQSTAAFPPPTSTTHATDFPTSPNYRAASNTSSLSPVPPTLPTDYPPHQPHATPTYPRPPSSGFPHPSHSHSANPSKHNFSRPLPPALESTQPFRPLCQAHMDALPRGHRVLPPCDRCRRLRMDCVKNLTSCAGCTKKHARCHWRDVGREEIGALEGMEGVHPGESGSYADEEGYGGGGYGGAYDDYSGEGGMVMGMGGGGYGMGGGMESEDDDSNPLEDLEALGEQEEQERADEEGMRNARELARRGWEMGLKVVQEKGESGGEGESGMETAEERINGEVAEGVPVAEIGDLATGPDQATPAGDKSAEDTNTPRAAAESVSEAQPAEPEAMQIDSADQSTGDSGEEPTMNQLAASGSLSALPQHVQAASATSGPNGETGRVAEGGQEPATKGIATAEEPRVVEEAEQTSSGFHAVNRPNENEDGKFNGTGGEE